MTVEKFNTRIVKTFPVYTLLLCYMLLSVQASGQEPHRIHNLAGFEVEVIGDLKNFTLTFDTKKITEGLEIVTLTLTAPARQAPPEFTLKWGIPSSNIAGQWTSGRYVNKTIRPDWTQGRFQESMFARNAPVSCLFGSDHSNRLTFAVSDALNTIKTGSGIREEDGVIYNEVVFFSERHEDVDRFTAQIRFDKRNIPYYEALNETGLWWAQQPGYEPAMVPAAATMPVYSTWYNYHQSIDAAVLLKEVAIAKTLGFETIIIDDGWQTMDTRRGYAYTGDWEPERIPDMKGFVDACHKIGIKVMLWYAVPFVGKNARVVEKFKDKSLRYEERLGAYVIDPRYPEVREHMIGVYRKAIREWGIDGFKLDFIERFVADEHTVLEATGGRDIASVNEATDKMMTDILAELKKVKPDVMIEFRQPYMGPLIRKYGNMFRASDCPNSYVANRVKTTDLRLLANETAVHADMIMWHPEEPVEAAALQLLNIMFSVPQVSVRLHEIPAAHLDMIRFYIGYWNANRAVLLNGKLAAPFPMENYPMLAGYGANKQIIGLYTDQVVSLDRRRPTEKIDIINAKSSESVVVEAPGSLGKYAYSIRNATGKLVTQGETTLKKGVSLFTVPAAGLLVLEKK